MVAEPLAGTTIAFIGGGNMARCLIAGVRAAGVDAAYVRVGEPDAGTRSGLATDFGVEATADNAAAARGAGIVVLAVKPQAAAAAARSIAPALNERTLVVSIMAGVRLAALQRWLGTGVAVIRAMPNTPALVGMGASALVAAEDTLPAAKASAQALLESVGIVVWLDDESQMDAVTALSGSGPAYAFLVLEALADAGTALGLPSAIARELSVRTMRGAAEMAVRTGEPPETLRTQVTSPGGTTAAALEVLERGHVREAFARAVAAAAARGAELADEAGGGP